MLKYLLFYILIFQTLTLSSQELAWFNSINNVLTTSKTLIDKENNVYSLGNFSDSLIIQNNIVYSSNSNRNYIAKYNEAGNLLFVKNLNLGYGTTIEKVCLDNNDNVIIAAKSVGFEYEALVVFKLDSFGNIFSSKGTLGNANNYPPDIHISQIKTDNSNNIIVIGSIGNDFSTDSAIFSGNMTDNIFIQKIKNNGDLIWINLYETPDNDYVVDLAIDNLNNLYITGFFRDEIIFDSTDIDYQFYSNGLRDMFILKLDSSGTFLNAKQFGQKGDDTGNTILLTENNEIILSGGFSDTLIFQQDTLTSMNSSTGFIVKFDSNFNVQWYHTFGNQFNYKLKIDNEQNIYSLGLFSDSIIVNGDTIKSNGFYDNYIQKFDTFGNIQITSIIHSHNVVNNDILLDFNIDNNQNHYFSGLYNDSISFELPYLQENFYGESTKNAFTIKLKSSIINSLNTIVEENKILIYPMPSKDIIYLQGGNMLINSKLSVYNNLGKLILTKKLLHKNNSVNIQSFKKGVYFYKINNNSNKNYSSGKIIKE